jgi:hypothetical protein
MFRIVSTTVIVALASIVVLVINESADAARMRCGSSWELCAERGRGPGAAQGVVQPGSTQKKVKRPQR